MYNFFNKYFSKENVRGATKHKINILSHFIHNFDDSFEKRSILNESRMLLEGKVSEFYTTDLIKYRCLLMLASLSCPLWFDNDKFDIKIQDENDWAEWRKYAILSYKQSIKCFPTIFKSFSIMCEQTGIDFPINTEIFFQNVEKLTEKHYEIEATIENDKSIIGILIQDAKILVYENQYIEFLDFVKNYSFYLLKSNEHEKFDYFLSNLYLKNCIIPVRFYVSLLVLAELSKKINIKNVDFKSYLQDPEIYFNIGNQIKDKADNNWKNISKNCKNLNEWLYGLYELHPLYEVSEIFFKLASSGFKENKNSEMESNSSKEAYAAEELRVECWHGIKNYGNQLNMVISSLLLLGINKDIGNDELNEIIYYNFKGLPRLPKFLYKKITKYFKNNELKKENLFQELNNMSAFIEKSLDKVDLFLFKQADNSRTFANELDVKNIDMRRVKEMYKGFKCPNCNKRKLLFNINKIGEEGDNRYGSVICKNIFCRSKFAVEYGVIKWGESNENLPFVLY